MSLTKDEIEKYLNEIVRLAEVVISSHNNNSAGTIKSILHLMADDLSADDKKRKLAEVLIAKGYKYRSECDIAKKQRDCESDKNTSENQDKLDIFGRPKGSMFNHTNPTKSKDRVKVVPRTLQLATPKKKISVVPRDHTPKTPGVSPAKGASPASVVGALSKRWLNDLNIDNSPSKQQKRK